MRGAGEVTLVGSLVRDQRAAAIQAIVPPLCIRRGRRPRHSLGAGAFGVDVLGVDVLGVDAFGVDGFGLGFSHRDEVPEMRRAMRSA